MANRKMVSFLWKGTILEFAFTYPSIFFVGYMANRKMISFLWKGTILEFAFTYPSS